ncbi:hypothetical protein BDV27DRAFT_151524 [Aspergillus caelatus]|uniref:Uncharacterized protein n=1 Tax=Aspergillus caelatus TaxID=61420 RepID=A0A5N6ZLW6_9EURO|nr:uncharacterized protein BDV27DRAFT_151524 [Aspergillus caelatus]KAE8357180.1 hypothetical protein BDV27DRAFT_151524 [Aspergillus caelatus]
MVPPSPIPSVHKRGRLRVYSFTAQKQTSNIAQQRRKRQSTRAAERKLLLPPLSSPTLPVNSIPDNIPSIAPETVVLSATPLPTVSVEIIIPCSTSPNRLDLPDPEILLAETQYFTQHTDYSGLKDYLERVLTEGGFPDVLRVPTIARRKDHLARQVSKLSHADPVHVLTEVTFDFNSIVGFASSLAVIKQGVHLHLDPLPVQYLDPQGRFYRTLRAVHEIPHYTFGRLTGFKDISLILLFPRLYRKEQSLIQYYPSSFEYSRLNGTARGVEPRMQRVESTARQQQLCYFLPPDILLQIWAKKNLKTLTKASTWEGIVQLFQRYWDCVSDQTYQSDRLYLDIGKETCPAGLSRVGSTAQFSTLGPDPGSASFSTDDAGPRTVLWRRCCLESYSKWIQQQQSRGSPPPRV